MDIPQTFYTAPPIEQIISRVHIGLSNCRGFPQLYPRFEFFAIQELPVGVDEEAGWLEEVMDCAQDIQPKFTRWDMVEGGKR